MQTENTTPFENLPLAKSEIPASLIGMYRVYKDAKNFTSIQASSALEALENSGMGHAFKIERESFHQLKLMNPTFWNNATPGASAPPPAVSPEVAATPPAEAAPEVPAAPTGDAPLSNNDVDKLLNG